MLENWAPWLCITALAVCAVNGYLMAELIGAIKAYDEKVERLAVFEMPQAAEAKADLGVLARLDKVEADFAKMKGSFMALNGIEQRFRDMIRKHWKRIGMVKPAKGKK